MLRPHACQRRGPPLVLVRYHARVTRTPRPPGLHVLVCFWLNTAAFRFSARHSLQTKKKPSWLQDADDMHTEKLAEDASCQSGRECTEILKNHRANRELEPTSRSRSPSPTRTLSRSRAQVRLGRNFKFRGPPPPSPGLRLESCPTAIIQ
jgi:hypothetical protein